MISPHPARTPSREAEILRFQRTALLVLHRSYRPRFELLARMRGELRAGLLLAGLPEETIERCVLVADELLANAIKASRPGEDEIDVLVHHTADGDLLLEVYDTSPDQADETRAMPHRDEESGRGLPLCDLLCKSPVEQFPLDDGKVTVAVLAGRTN
ncbi:ATP-binding protein [Actinocorallia sp. B10E7]|uniref:ATP-binding protein n=1 Tax=Actinocorallia sp. B10E7 TaxID=3153558 RepID=UPI00325D37D2